MYSLILLNGGVGARLGAASPKQFIKVNGMPILVYSLVAANDVEEIDQIVLNYPEGWRPAVEDIVSDYAINTRVTYVEPGESRHDSVRRMLEKCTNDRVIVHESARPLVTTQHFHDLIAADRDNVSFMTPIPFTVAPVDPDERRVTGHLERDSLRNVQLPQKFLYKDLAAAHQYARDNGLDFTEDATLCTVAGQDVFFIDGDDRNIKVTTRTDIQFANLMLGDIEEFDA